MTHTLDSLNAASEPDFVAALGDIFEHAPWVAQAAALQRPFASLKVLHDAMLAAVRGADEKQRLTFLRGHPDLAGKAARAGAMTAASTAEQLSFGVDRMSELEFAEFNLLNDAYKKKFGIPFIICVRRHTRDSILCQFERRLQHDVPTEHAAAVTEIGRISALRLDGTVSAPERLKVHGRLSTHVLDTQAGRPAPGLRIELHTLSRAGESALVVETVTNADGRTDKPLIGERPVPIGTYELRFHVGVYFAQKSVPLADPPFLDIVPLRFAVAEPEGHYHVPLLMTPWSYSTYRGS